MSYYENECWHIGRGFSLLKVEIFAFLPTEAIDLKIVRGQINSVLSLRWCGR